MAREESSGIARTAREALRGLSRRLRSRELALRWPRSVAVLRGVRETLEHIFEERRTYRTPLAAMVEGRTFRRLANNVAAEWSDHRQTTVVRNKPTNAIFELTNHCNLRCPLCNTGGLRGSFPETERGFMSFETFRAGIDRLLPELQSVLLYSWGEPLLNPIVFAAIAHARRSGVHTQISSNMMLCDEEKSRKLVESGLTRLIVSCDGMTQETYEKYRKRGSLERLTANVDRLVSLKGELGTRHPRIYVQFIVFRHNEHEMADFERFWMDRGADAVNFIRMSYMSKVGEMVARDLDLVPRSKEFQPFHPYGRLKRCSDPYKHVTIDWNGDWYTCCFPPGETAYRFGNIVADPFWDVWNGPRYRYSRALLREQRVGPDSADTMCHDCTGVFPGPETRRYFNVGSER